MWSTIQNLKAINDLPWLVIGDFNEAMWNFEHLSLTPRPEPQMAAFRDTLILCELVDLGFVGVPYTYDNMRSGGANVRVRLDRAVATNSWRNLFAFSSVSHLASGSSDHVPLLLRGLADTQKPTAGSMQYEIFWETDAGLPEVIKKAWESFGVLDDLGKVNIALRKNMSTLRTWSKKRFGNVTREINKTLSCLEELMNMNADRREIRAASDKLNELLYKEEMLWLQRSCIAWLKEGDRNTKYFQSKARWRARKNRIRELVDDEGISHSDEQDMGSMATQYFQNMYCSDPNLDATTIVSLFDPVVSEDDNLKLCTEFSDKEISDALFQIRPLKAPEPDGFPARFFQRNWDTLKGNIIIAVREFFKTGVMPEGVNDTSIVLIPKLANPIKLSDFRPISLCNVVYKVVSKCLVNRLMPLLDDIISLEQSAFVPGRMIADNALVAFECFHYIKQEKDPTKSFCSYKLDLSKAYDRVDWRFLKQVMQKLGFAQRWIDWIMTCVTSVRYSVKFNGTLLDSFAPSRGLRQGDPLSPFMFLFVADGLSAILKHGVASNSITPVKICRRAPGISHLLFADDTLLFFEASRAQAENVKGCLELYAKATGQCLNYNKCSILFGDSCPVDSQNEVRGTLDVINWVF
uniref:Reverse transcriptase domain-containing protein n=1 Tax=Aegilops tauschii subsp. strangulata TaxID=200361 RepID=A0A453EYZ0_AEGTS